MGGVCGRPEEVEDTHRLLVPLQSSFLLPESLAQLGQPALHGGHLQAPLLQAAPLLLQVVALLLVPSAPQLEVTDGGVSAAGSMRSRHGGLTCSSLKRRSSSAVEVLWWQEGAGG